MARPKNQFPELKWHVGDKQFCIYRDGRRVRLGDDRAKAETRRLAIIAQITGQPIESPLSLDALSLDEALEMYRQHLIRARADNRKISRINAVISALSKQGAMLASAFRGPALKLMRAELVKRKDAQTGKPLSRRYINHLVDSLVLAFRWMVANDLAPADNLTRLREMSAELAESSDAEEGGGGRETGKIAAVTDVSIEGTIPHCAPIVAAMIRIQNASGLRPGELVSMRRREISTKPDELITVAGIDGKKVGALAFDGELIWLYCPTKHKNLHRGKPRIVALGADAQKVLSPLLNGLDADDLVFRSVRGKPFSSATYCHAICQAVHRANLKRQIVEPWSPNRLRKAAAQRVDAALGREGADAAAAMLGHSASRQALDYYITEQIEKACAAAAKAG